MKGQFMVISAMIISAIVISTASSIFETSSREFQMDQTAYKLENIRQEAQKVDMTQPKERENFRKLVDSIDGFSTETIYWRSQECFNVTTRRTGEKYELKCVGGEWSPKSNTGGSKASSTLTFYKGSSIVLSKVNSELVWGQDYTFDAEGFNIYKETFEIDRTGNLKNYNISVASIANSNINTILWKYDLGNSPNNGETILKAELDVPDSDKVNFKFNAIPSISSGSYQLTRNSVNEKTFSSGGELSWEHDDGSGDYNYSLTYKK